MIGLVRMLHDRRGLLAWAVLCVAALALLGACENDEEGEELGGEIGPGSGGPAVVEASVVTDPLTTPDGHTLGGLSYDSGYFIPVFTGGAADEIHYIYVDAAQTLELTVSRISGRADTPCRFSAALLARDEGFSILASGDVVNDTGLELHQVNMARDDTFLRFYCAELQSNVGIQISATSLAGNRLDYEQVHFLLNSLGN